MCPMLKKVFTDHTHIVAIRPTGNVYCWEVRPLSNLSGHYKASAQSKALPAATSTCV